MEDYRAEKCSPHYPHMITKIVPTLRPPAEPPLLGWLEWQPDVGPEAEHFPGHAQMVVNVIS